MSYEPPERFAWNFCPICGMALVVTHDGQDDRPHCAACRRFYYRNPVPAACCFVRRGAGELLFARRAVHPAKGEWTLPGGFIELDETSEEAVLRELHEETGLTGYRPRLLGISTKQSPVSGAIMVIGYIIDTWEGELVPDTDASELRFFAKHERPPLPFSVHRELMAMYDRL
ncbi:MAG: NUDIX hydrolase [Candidatus Hydrogenedentota bacterium]